MPPKRFKISHHKKAWVEMTEKMFEHLKPAKVSAITMIYSLQTHFNTVAVYYCIFNDFCYLTT